MNQKKLISQDKKMIKKLLELKTYQGDGEAAFRLFSGYARGVDEGFQKDLNLAFHYLECSADLGFPHALNFMATLYAGIEIHGIKKQLDLKKRIHYLKRLTIASATYNLNNLPDKERNEISELMWNAYATIGMLYIVEDELFKENNYLGYAISLKLAEEKGITQSMYALGRYYRDRGNNVYYPSATLMKQRDVWGMALYYYELAINNDNSRYAQAAMNEYNDLARYINERDGRTQETAIPYYRR